MTALDQHALGAAVVAYDDERRRSHGGTEAPMSDRNRETIAPMIGAAIEAYLKALPSDVKGVARSIAAMGDYVLHKPSQKRFASLTNSTYGQAGGRNG